MAAVSFLEGAGLEVLEAADADEAIQLLESRDDTRHADSGQKFRSRVDLDG